MKKINVNSNYIKFAVSFIIVLLIVIICLLSIPNMKDAREKAFRIEATKIVDASKDTMSLILKRKAEIGNDSNSCQNGAFFCMNISKLKEYGTYIPDSDNYVGKVEVDYSSADNPVYILYLKKSADLKIIKGTRGDYINMGYISTLPWEEKYETCKCEFEEETVETVETENVEELENN